MKTMIRAVLLFLLCCTGVANAEQQPFAVYETDALSIKLANDGTGVIKNMGCNGCDFNIANITYNSRASANGKVVSIFEARSRAGKPAMVSVNPDTREVQYIRWSE
ncbi:MAG: hypothetical protein RQ936_00685 [Gammaproteobacteria bacterium]|nr:hypothetical protein [Gammaproteobacteria bacterium]